MTTEEKNKLKKAELHIMAEIKRLCQKHKLPYFLDCGSMLGAVRHQGFIPWDDDMDVGMLLPHYETFCAIAQKELGEDFYIENEHTTPNTPICYSKIRLKGTQFVELKGNPSAEHNEIFVDIFPHFGVAEHSLSRKVNAFCLAVLAQVVFIQGGVKPWQGEGLLKNIKFLPLRALALILPRKLARKFMHIITHAHPNASMVGLHGGSCYHYWLGPKQVVQELEEVPFEGEMFPIPQNAHAYLTQVYGSNYMALPPEHQRTTHAVQVLDFGDWQF